MERKNIYYLGLNLNFLMLQPGKIDCHMELLNQNRDVLYETDLTMQSGTLDKNTYTAMANNEKEKPGNIIIKIDRMIDLEAINAILCMYWVTDQDGKDSLYIFEHDVSFEEESDKNWYFLGTHDFGMDTYTEISERQPFSIPYEQVLMLENGIPFLFAGIVEEETYQELDRLVMRELIRKSPEKSGLKEKYYKCYAEYCILRHKLLPAEKI